MHEPNPLHLIICCLMDGASDDGHDPEKVISWVEYHLGKQYANTLKGVFTQHQDAYQKHSYFYRDIKDVLN